MVEILRLAADIDETVDGAGAAEDAAPRIGDRAAGRAGIGFGLEVPSEGLVVEQLHKAYRDVDQRVPVAPARLDQHHLDRWVFGEAIGQDAAGRSGANDNVICPHLSSPSLSLRAKRSPPGMLSEGGLLRRRGLLAMTA